MAAGSHPGMVASTMNGSLPVFITWLALFNAMFTAFAASFYLGLMLVLRFVLKSAFESLTLDTLDVHFGQPIITATRFLRGMFVPYLLSAALLVWIGWGNTAAVVCAWLATASYAFMAVWFQSKMVPINTKLLSQDLVDNAELGRLIVRWNALNQVRVVTAVIYWFAALGFLVAAHHVWEGLS